MSVVKRRKQNGGFSLVELVVVVTIIGLLASVAVPKFQRYSAKSRQAEAKSSLAGLYTAERAFHSEWGSYFGDFRNIGYQPSGLLRYRHGFGAAGVNCPNGYVGAGAAAGAAPGAAYLDTSGSICGSFCSEITTPISPGAITATATAGVSVFTAEARGDVDADSTVDVWTVNHQKVFGLVQDDIFG